MGDDYSNDWVEPSSSYLNGNDMVFEFTLEEPVLLNGSLASEDNWIGLFIMEDCPNPDNPAEVLISSFSGSANSTSFENEFLPAGTYFAIVSSFPAPQHFEFTLNLTVTEVHLVEFSVTDGEEPLENVSIDIDGESPIITDENGVADIYLVDGAYDAWQASKAMKKRSFLSLSTERTRR